MAIDPISICNRTCDLLAINPISSFGDDSKAARVFARNYEAARDRSLRSYPWNCAMRVASLPATADKPAWGYERQFQLPEGPDPAYCLRVYRTEYEALGGTDDYKIRGRAIHSNAAAPLNIEYIARVEDPSLFDALLQEVIAADLGVYCGAQLIEAGSRMQAMVEYLGDVLKRAKIADAQEGTPNKIVQDYFLQARI